MKISMFSLKGGQGKTSIAINIALTCNFGIIANDMHTPFERVLSENKFIKVGFNEKFPEIEEEDNVIYDFGGWLDHRIINILEKSDIIIIPINKNFVDESGALKSIEEAKKFNEKIIIVANKTKIEDYEFIKRLVQKFFGNSIPVFRLKSSTAFDKIFQKRKSIRDIIKEDKSLAFSYREVNEQFNKILEYINSL